MGDLEKRFEEAAAAVKAFTKRPSDQDLLIIYGLYKQATVGDNNTSQPWALQVEARAKWEAWNKNKGMSQEQSKKSYIEEVEKLKKDNA